MSDPRTLRSRDALVAAMTGALDADGDTLSITEICVRAGVSRPTFYQHFGDVPALIAAAAVERVDSLFAELPTPPADPGEWRISVSHVVARLLAGLDEHRDFYRRVLAGPAAFTFHEQVIHYLTERLLVASPLAESVAVDARFARQTAVFLSAGCTVLLTLWAFAESPAYSSDELADQVAALLVAGVLTLRR